MRMVGTGVMGLLGSIRAGSLVNRAAELRNRIAFRCSTKMTLDGTIITASYPFFCKIGEIGGRRLWSLAS